ncbi:release factor glutamine methyltransferase [Desulfatibacillum alkenivorans DSM 16219]|jgi:release factor glutamine methyltransferase|uniref:Release factor glutamine methyltransferase n=1 Tax=Desulfatibacillum alkenivorans DSM 16219 TaxID=1121393 RepID=A0A1M6C665_9BACT|nr:peptide chain release factor N(5)-glutamine methyltransferase [Desulfatibacillum alkenivorans]SHI56228.1 release factor glutamine methyltransferase [Desulfatibacillum alkenivorans DSM 16219]
MAPETWTIQKILKWTTDFFSEKQVEAPRLSAEILLSHCLDYPRIHLYTRHDQPLNPEELGRFRGLVKRRAAREPVAYIVGNRDFWTLELDVNPSVLIPRPETETLVETALEVLSEAPAPMRVLDLGTGSGAIILALAAEKPEHHYMAVDYSPQALETAKANAQKHNLNVDFYKGSWFEAVRCLDRFDLVVSNPPYIPSRDIPGLMPEVARYEPMSALDGGPQGMDHLALIIERAPEHLKPGGWLMLEMGFDQKDLVEQVALETQAYENLRFVRDLAGHYRTAVMQRPAA